MKIETIIHWLGGLITLVVLIVLFYGIWRGTRQKMGHATGHAGQLLRSSLFYFLVSLFFFGLSYLGWIRIQWNISPQARLWMLILGSFLFFLGMALLLWARLTLGRNYFVSTTMGVQLFADHQLVTTGPYAVIRHPMYVGLILAAWGAWLIYFTWTTVYFAVFAPFLAFRAYREEQALSAEFGDQWRDYCKHVPAFIPKLKR